MAVGLFTVDALRLWAGNVMQCKHGFTYPGEREMRIVDAEVRETDMDGEGAA